MYMYWSHQLTQPITVLIHVSLNYVTNCSLKKQIHFIFITKLWYIIIFLHKNKKNPLILVSNIYRSASFHWSHPVNEIFKIFFFLMKTTWILYLLKLKQKILKTYININYPSIIFFLNILKYQNKNPEKKNQQNNETIQQHW